MTTQQAAADFLNYVAQLANSEIVWSGGQLTVVPYGDTPATGSPPATTTWTGTIPGAPYQISVPGWLEDFDVWRGTDGVFFLNVPEDPQEGQYSVVNGLYTFNAADATSPINIVYGARNAALPAITFTPNLTPEYSLGPDDFLADKGNPPVTGARTAISDAYNWFQMEYYDRTNNYNPTIADAKDLTAIDQYGPRIQTSVEAHAITNRTLAQFIGQAMLQKSLYIRNTYSFKLDGRYFLLDPMDWVELNIPKFGFSGTESKLCRIISIEEADDGSFDFLVEEWPEAVGTPAIHTLQPCGGLQLDWNADPGAERAAHHLRGPGPPDPEGLRGVAGGLRRRRLGGRPGLGQLRRHLLQAGGPDQQPGAYGSPGRAARRRQRSRHRRRLPGGFAREPGRPLLRDPAGRRSHGHRLLCGRRDHQLRDRHPHRAQSIHPGHLSAPGRLPHPHHRPRPEQRLLPAGPGRLQDSFRPQPDRPDPVR